MAPDSKHRRYILGIDLGTTTTKVALVDTQTKDTVRTLSRETQASTHSELGSLGNEQVSLLIVSVELCSLRDHARPRYFFTVSERSHGVSTYHNYGFIMSLEC